MLINELLVLCDSKSGIFGRRGRRRRRAGQRWKHRQCEVGSHFFSQVWSALLMNDVQHAIRLFKAMELLLPMHKCTWIPTILKIEPINLYFVYAIRSTDILLRCRVHFVLLFTFNWLQLKFSRYVLVYFMVSEYFMNAAQRAHHFNDVNTNALNLFDICIVFVSIFVWIELAWISVHAWLTMENQWYDAIWLGNFDTSKI